MGAGASVPAEMKREDAIAFAAVLVGQHFDKEWAKELAYYENVKY